MTKQAALVKGFSEEMQKVAIVGVLAAGGLLAALGFGERKRKQKAFTKKLTGRYQPGAGMITPPRSY